MTHSDPIRVLLVSHSAQFIGAERSLFEHAKSLKASNFDVSVSVPRRGPLRDRLLAESINVYVIPTPLWVSARATGLIGWARLALAIAATPIWLCHLLITRPMAVVTNSLVVPTAASACLLLRIPHAWFIRESILTNPALNSSLSPQSLLAWVSRTSKCVFVISEFIYSQVRPAIGTETAIYTFTPPVRLTQSQLTASRTGSDDTLHIAFASSLTKDKGFDDVLRALAILEARTGVKPTVSVAGCPSPKARDAAERLANELDVLDRIDWVGWIDDIADFYKNAHLAIMTSRNEGFGRVTLEALACGVPVIGYRAGATTEILRDGGGVLVHPSPEALAHELERLAEDREALSSIASETVGAARKFLDTDVRLRRFSLALPARLGLDTSR